MEHNGISAHRISVVQMIGTENGTILGPSPPQMSREITEVTAAGFGTTGGPAITGRLMQFATIQGYSQYGTVLGTVVEPFSVLPGETFMDGSGGDVPIAYNDPGCNLYGVADSGSVLVKVVYRPVYARGA